jgi:hypothetical protein
MSNISINTVLPYNKLSVTNNNVNTNLSNFDEFLKKDNLPSLQPTTMPTLSGKMTMPDGTTVNLEPVNVTIYSHEESIQLLQESGLSRAEAEALLAPVDLSGVDSSSGHIEKTPEEYKAYFQSKQVDAVAYDADGRVTAKIYTDGSLMCDNDLVGQMSKCTTNAEKIRVLQSQRNVTVENYSKEKVTDFDLLKRELAWLEKERIIYPERDTQDMMEAINFKKRILAL